ncbi:MAG: hypothetical protein M1816_006686 [Peltula sp. TS41687]|nr:MAG: hypothetical protein M1816_006686 [Peltula sp. TS41687]
MSTAAMPAVQPTATTTLDPRSMNTSLSPSRQYQPPQPHQPSSTRDNQQTSQTSHVPARSSRSPRRPSRGTNAGHVSSSSPPPSSRLPNSSSPANSHTATPRTQPLPSSTQNSPRIPTATVSPDISYGAPTQLEYGGGPPIPPPPRTSSTQQGHQIASSVTAHTGTSTGDARLATDNRPSSSRAAHIGDGRERGDRERGATAGQTTGNERERTKDGTASAAAAAARSRRRAPREAREEEPQRSSSTREPRARDQQQHAVQSRSSGTVDVSSATGETGMSREGSRVINRYVVTDPVVDLERERERLAEARPVRPGTDITPITGLGLVGSEGVDDGGRGGGKSRQEHSSSHSRRKDNKFGDYFLGQTLGEGEFGKVRMGWKQEGGVQVAVKLIRKESINNNPSRLPKIYREIAILRELSHPNIVRLHEMVETDRHIGIILEYASGGELFDYILNHRYLKDPAARRLFAQLVSGVGYLHKKGIVHRDLKLENLLLDRNRNIIITDFGFANTFDPSDELGDEIEYNLTNKDYVKRMDLERVRNNGFRRGDLMQTSCGSPCYAAPELVVSDSLYTGRKVDVWSCGVILYAMLAGYLPFDDDPANPEGDNINLLYKYIVSTPLTFPDYVTPHARDLLRRILVADPVKRADLFEVARHSWLSEYAHVVSFITSSTTTTGEIANTTVTSDPQQDTPLLARSASVREPSKTHQPHLAVVGGLSQKHGNLDPDIQSSQNRPHRDAKRRTVQVEYVAPSSETSRVDPQVAEPSAVEVVPASSSKARVAPGNQGPVDVVSGSRYRTTEGRQDATGPGYQGSTGHVRTKQRPSTSSQAQGAGMGPPARPVRDVPRSVSDSTGAFAVGSSIARPNTGGSLASTGSRSGLPSRGSYTLPGQPVAPTVATTNAHGKLAQPKNGKHYVISNPMPQQQDEYGRSSSYGRLNVTAAEPNVEDDDPAPARTHKRSNTVGGIGEKLFGRGGTLFGSKSQTQTQTGQEQAPRRVSKAHPPTSMSGPIVVNSPRRSTDSRRSTSFGFGRKGSRGSSGLQEKPKRFSFLPAAFSFKSIGGSGSSSAKDLRPPRTAQSMTEPSQPHRPNPKRPEMAFGRGLSQSTAGYTTDENLLAFDGPLIETTQQQATQVGGSTANAQAPRQGHADQGYAANQSPPPTNLARVGYDGAGASRSATASESSLPAAAAAAAAQPPGPYPAGFNAEDEKRGSAAAAARGPSVLQKPNRKFVEAYEAEPERRYAHGGQNSGSSGAARKVMDFFRRRGKAKAWEER